ncbi:hypothetical protein L6164_020597 [Bauhinia variegata]|uniref:Uncharacterized protein n=1 Tax=Bauhinia variegata TaxID=167791 RepID=A0ACB9MXN1_BAUVA|nr:hypothetical protein L6164_020597 [Bauhinia variegata]
MSCEGPVYAAMFNPLGIVIALGLGVAFLGEALYLGSMVGAAIIVAGFYAVIWGKLQEEKMVNQKIECCNCVSSSGAAPLLQNRSMEV